jgi:DeoR/GlpR family transcriptional regulator of sugar metabolism
MLREKRHRKIVDMLREEKSISILELSKRLAVSYMTIWRDLVTLEQEGLLSRTRGGALSALEAEPHGQDFNLSIFTHHPDNQNKTDIAHYAAANLVKDGDNIIIEAGSTASSMMPYLQQSGLTVLTNGLHTSLLGASRLGTMTIICSGGVLIDNGAFIGPQAEDFFSHYRVNKAFFSVQGVTLEDGFTDQTPLYKPLKCAMYQSAEQIIMLVDSSKFGVRALVQVMALDEVDILVTDSAAPKDTLEALNRRGIQIHVAG